MQHKGQPLGGRQGLQDDEEGDADRIGKHRLGFGIDGSVTSCACGSVVERLFRTGAAGSQHVQADPCHDGGQPAAQIAHIGDVGAIHPQPRLLHRVLGLGNVPSIR